MPSDLERLQCPNCGAELAPENRDTLFCFYCGVRLRIRTGASGNSMAVLDSIKSDTNIMAKRSALAYLEEEMAALQDKRNALQRTWRQADEKRKSITVRLLGVYGGIALLIGVLTLRNQGIRWAAIGLGLCCLAWLWHRVLADKANRAQAALNPQIEELGASVEALAERIATLKAEIDRAVSEL